MSPLQSWQLLANTFHAIDLLISYGKLPAEYKPEDAIRLYREVPLSGTSSAFCSMSGTSTISRSSCRRSKAGTLGTSKPL